VAPIISRITACIIGWQCEQIVFILVLLQTVGLWGRIGRTQ